MKKIFEDKSEEPGSDYHIRLFSKKLASGKCQVKFYLNSLQGTDYYGYILAEGKETVSMVVSRIHRYINDTQCNSQPDLKYLIQGYKSDKASHDLFLLRNQ